jgi:hypothetical protein
LSPEFRLFLLKVDELMMDDIILRQKSYGRPMCNREVLTNVSSSSLSCSFYPSYPCPSSCDFSLLTSSFCLKLFDFFDVIKGTVQRDGSGRK